MLTALTISLAMMVTNHQYANPRDAARTADALSHTPHTYRSAPLHPQSTVGKRPSRWCGWYMRKKLGVAPAKYNLARSWYSWGSPSQPRIGAVVVWPNHVGLIVGQNTKGQWLIESGNDGGKVRTRTWNLRGAKFRVA